MGIFSFIEKAQEKMLNKSEDKKISSANKGKKSRTAKLIINMFYSDYPEIPYISNEREKAWIERAERFPAQSIISKKTMTRFADGLLPGHIYMLYWLKKYTNKKVPVYFEYKYGVDFEKEIVFLKDNGFLNELNKPTEKGEKAIQKHYIVIENHAQPKPDRSIEGIRKQIIEQRNSMRKNGFTQYEFIASRNACEKCKELNGKHFPLSKLKIGVNAPPMHEGCSCSIAGYESRAEYDKWLNNL